MLALSPGVMLVQSVLVETMLTTQEALELIDTALQLEVDPLAYCAHRFGLGETVVFERAAAWANMPFYPRVPSELVKLEEFTRIDSLGTTRRLRAKTFDRDFVFWAPTFPEFLRMSRLPASADYCICPPSAIVATLAEAAGELLMDESRQRLTRVWPFATAHLDLGFKVRLLFVLGVAGLTATAVAPIDFSLLFLPASIALLLGPALMRMVAVLSPPDPATHSPFALDDDELPVYTVLIPLRDEAKMVPMLARSMRAMNYPPEKLDIKFVVEDRSLETIKAVEDILDSGPFGLVVVPDQMPRTKPKALNFALPFARGEFIVVYDAEDIPDPDQLRLAASRFADDPEMTCLQAALVIDNARENILTALFASEYAGLFGVMLPALARWDVPMPLGGTSNHFRVGDLKSVGSWDAFNVTEDADLGIRLARLHRKSGILASETREEAPVRLKAWMKQRTRWMKGWMQTYIVHNRNPRQFLRDTGWRGFLAFEIYVGGIILAPLLHTLFIAVAVLRVFVPEIWESENEALMLFNNTVMATGYFGAITLVLRGLWQRGERRLFWHQILLPFYWTLHSIATVRALIELIFNPYFWAKTTHGETRIVRGASVVQPKSADGDEGVAENNYNQAIPIRTNNS